MKLIKPSFEIIEQLPGLEGVYKQIELAGRTCYKSYDKITEDSAKEFVDRMIKSSHGAMLEHGTVYLHMEFISKEEYFNCEDALKYHNNPFSRALRVRDDENDKLGKQHAYITTNLRVLVENGWLDDLQYITEPTEHHERRHTVKFICDRGVSHEFVRHRTMSFAQESSRYCNYSKDKFSNEITYITPCWFKHDSLHFNSGALDIVDGFSELKSTFGKDGANFLWSLLTAEDCYMDLIKEGWKAQEARAVLPNALKTELVMTGFASDWKHFFDLRTPGSAHPQARELAIPLYNKFKELKWVD